MLGSYSDGSHRDKKVITVFVGGCDLPDRDQCDTLLTMDPEIEPPVLVIPFGGVKSQGVQDENFVARWMIANMAPKYFDDSFYYKCMWISDFLLIKVLVH
jgi:hypothetical protein